MSMWPADANGDVFRRLREGGFDFCRACVIDFNADFEAWPPPNEAIAILIARVPNVVVLPPSEDGDGYVQFQLLEQLTHDLVVRTQLEVTEWMAPFGGVCELWGVLH